MSLESRTRLFFRCIFQTLGVHCALSIFISKNSWRICLTHALGITMDSMMWNQKIFLDLLNAGLKNLKTPMLLKLGLKLWLDLYWNTGSVGWSPSYRLEKIDSVQKQVLYFELGHLRWDSRLSLTPHTCRLKLINLPTLVSYGKMLGIKFLVKILNGTICSSCLLSEGYFNIPARFSRQFRSLLLNSGMSRL